MPPPAPAPEADPEYDPRITDEEMTFLLKSYLRPDQFSDTKLIKFILHYTTFRSAPDAAEHAGFPRARGNYWRARPEVHACIEAITAKAVMKYGYDASETVARAKEIATLDPIEFQNPDGSFKTHMSQIKPEARRAIKKFKCKNLFGQDANGMQIVIGQLIEVEIWDKLKGIELLGREKNIFKQTTVHEHDVTTNMASLLLESGRRSEQRQISMARDVNPQGESNEVGKSSDRDEGWTGVGVPLAISGQPGGGYTTVDDIEVVPRKEAGDQRNKGSF